MKKLLIGALSLLFVLSCKKEVELTFSEVNILHNDNAVIELNIPRANEDTDVGKSINKVINDHIANTLNFSEDFTESIPLEQAIKKFQEEYKTFKADFEESALVWEATFDGEVVYKSNDVICIALSNYTNTGGAHGNANITLYNFNLQSGSVYSLNDLVSDEEALTALAKDFFIKELEMNSDEHLEDYFFGEDFHLPANIGFNEDGLLMLYNVYEIASYAQGITEFTIPFKDVQPLLKLY